LLSFTLSKFKAPIKKLNLNLSPISQKKKIDANEIENELVPTAIHNAVFDFDLNKIEAMLDQHGLSADIVDDDDDSNYTLLLSCISLADAETEDNALQIVSCLLNRGADVNHIGNDGSTPLILIFTFIDMWVGCLWIGLLPRQCKVGFLTCW
jgi:hypothetical protein